MSRVRVADADAIEDAARLLRTGGLVALPTETVYGLGADATDARALQRVFAAKGRPADHPLIVHLAASDELERWSRSVPPAASRLAAAFWPGPLTIVVLRRDTISPAATGGRPTVGLRVPDHPAALALLRAVGRPVAAPSANRFGRVSPTTAADVAAEFADVAPGVGPDLILDGGPCRVGVESTIVELVGERPVLLRPGGVPAEAIEEVLGERLDAPAGPSRAPGMLASHYAPNAALDLIAWDSPELALGAVAAQLAAGRCVAVLGLPDALAERLDPKVVRLGPVGDTDGYARWLYRRLREADDAGVDRVVALLPPPQGLGSAIHDRLQKAAAPRPT